MRLVVEATVFPIISTRAQTKTRKLKQIAKMCIEGVRIDVSGVQLVLDNCAIVRILP